MKFHFTFFLWFHTLICGASISFSTELHSIEHLDAIDLVLIELEIELFHVEKVYSRKRQFILNNINATNRSIDECSELTVLVELLKTKDQLSRSMQKLHVEEKTDLSKIRYIKGLQIVKILYEKALSLDHHFASVATLRDLNNLSNPNSYNDFSKIKDHFETRKNKRIGFDLSGMLQGNIYTSVAHSLISLFTNDSKSKLEKESDLKEMECILDFTLRVHNDLNIIYYETTFLQQSNARIIENINKLFVDYTKPINYRLDLDYCRNSDDWDSVRQQLNQYLELLEEQTAQNEIEKANLMRINLEFPIDRLLQFITEYNTYINQAGEFYQKFAIMLDSYENKDACDAKIPKQFDNLKENINIAIEKFNTAYKPVEINGSKLKEILYGINEYD